VQGFQNTLNVFKESSVGRYFNDLYLSSRAIYWSMAIGIIYCLIYIELMSAFAEYIAWISIFIFQIGLIALSAGIWMSCTYSAQ
jgi:hypothetical protein